MRSLYDDILALLRGHDFSLGDVAVREPNDERKKVYPMVVVHEIVNVPTSHSTVTGEAHTTVGYQFDIDTTKCTDNGTVLSAFEAGRRLMGEVDGLLDGELKLTRRFANQGVAPAPDVVRHILRSEATLAGSDYTYRR